MSKIRERLKQKAEEKYGKKDRDTAFENQLKGVLDSRGHADFAQKVKDVVSKVRVKKFNPSEESVLLQVVTVYSSKLADNPSSVTHEDIETLSIFTKSQITKPESFYKHFNLIINLIRSAAINEQIQSREYSEEILLHIHKAFNLASDIPLEKSLQQIMSLVSNQFPIYAAELYKDLESALISPNQKTVFTSSLFIDSCKVSCKNGDFAYLQQVVDLFKINLQTTIIHKLENEFANPTAYSPMAYVNQQQGKTLQESSNLKEKYIKFLINNKLHPNDIIEGFGENKKATPFMEVCLKGDLVSAKLLIENGADINKEIYFKNYGGGILLTPLICAVGSRNLELIKYLLEKNANPLKIFKILDAQPIKNIFTITIQKITSTGGVIETSTDVTDYEYFSEVLDLIDIHCVSKIFHSIEHDEGYGSEEKSEEPIIDKIDKLVKDYTEFKQREMFYNILSKQKKDITLEAQFDILLLKFFNSNVLEDLQSLQKYIEENPELNLYDETGLYEMIEDKEELPTILAKKKNMIHDFFQAKKSEQAFKFDHSEKHKSPIKESLKDGANIFLVNSAKLINKIYVAIDPGLIKSNKFKKIEKEVLSVLSNNLKLITDDSQGISGIKSYQGIIKLKLCGKDSCLYATKKYLDKNTGDVLIILDKIGNHAMRTNQKLITEKVENLAEIYSDTLCQQEIGEQVQQVESTFGLKKAELQGEIQQEDIKERLDHFPPDANSPCVELVGDDSVANL